MRGATGIASIALIMSLPFPHIGFTHHPHTPVPAPSCPPTHQVHTPPHLPDDATLCLVHTQEYVDAFSNGRLDEQRVRRIGLGATTSQPILVERTKAEVAGEGDEGAGRGERGHVEGEGEWGGNEVAGRKGRGREREGGEGGAHQGRGDR